jgi:uncharacterized Tic20 family protein
MSNDQSSVVDPPQFEVSPEDKQWALFAHLSALVAMWLGGLGFLGPLIIWLIKKEQSRFVDDQGKEALNFNLNVLIAEIILGAVGVPFGLLTVGFGFLLVLPLFLVLFLASIIMPIIAAMKVNAGETYRYPYIFRIIV